MSDPMRHFTWNPQKRSTHIGTHEPSEELTRVALSKPVETEDGVLPAGRWGPSSASTGAVRPTRSSSRSPFTPSPPSCRTPFDMHVPDADKATLDLKKITHHLLVLDHPEGGPRPNSSWLAASAMTTSPRSRRRYWRTRSGTRSRKRLRRHRGVKYFVDCTLMTPDVRNPCIQIWIDDADGSPPRFVTAYPFL